MNKILILLFVFILLPFTTIIACSCMPPPTIEKAFQIHEVIIHAEVVSLNFIKMSETLNPVIAKKHAGGKNMGPAKSIIAAKVKILCQYQGNISEEITTIYTPRGGAACGYGGFEVGHEFIIYADNKSPISIFMGVQSSPENNRTNTYWTNNCSRTTIFDSEEFKTLNQLCN